MLPERLRLPEFEPEINAETDREAGIVLLTSIGLLLVFQYWGRPAFYNGSGVSDWVAENFGALFVEFSRVGGYLWWGAASLIILTLAPLAIIVWWIGRSPREYGFRISGIGRHIPMYGALYLATLPALFWASSWNSIQETYPFYDRAAEGGAAYWLYALGYAVQFVGVEAIFRGYMTFGLLRRFGSFAIPIMTIPYVMIHFVKPMPEAVAAIFAGLILGYLAVRSKSFVPGFVLHVAVAMTMDLLVLWRIGALGAVF
jgi:membrane protease YdiL (CAAX protease family)